VTKLIIYDRAVSLPDLKDKIRDTIVSGVSLFNIYKNFPFEDILNTIAEELSFNEFEAVVLYMFIKKIGWFSQLKMK